MWQDHVDYVNRKRKEVDAYVERQLVELTAYRNRQYAEIDAYEKRHIPPYIRNNSTTIREVPRPALPYCFSSEEG